MIKLIINAGLVIIPFFVWGGYSSREPKMAMAVVLALALGLLAVYQGKLKPFKNQWVLFFLGYMLLNFHLAPKPEILLFGNDVSLFWIWKPIFVIMVFALMLFTVSSIEFTRKDKDRIFNIMTWVGFLVAIYMCLQRFGIDQWFILIGHQGFDKKIDENSIGATLGNPVVASSFLVMIIPIALLIKRWGKALLMGIAVCITSGQIAIGALVIGLLSIFALKGKKRFIIITTFLVLTISLSGFLCVTNPKARGLIEDKDRFKVWGQIVKDLNDPIIEGSTSRYPFTGYGLGSFGYLFHIKHKSGYGSFKQAHNDYMELLFNTGLIGIILFLCMIGRLLKDNFILCRTNRETRYLLSSFICVAICAGGLFVFQLGAHCFYTITILGLLNNKGGEA